MAFTLNRRLAQLVDSNGQLNTGKIPNDYITSDHVADNTITSAMLHTSFTVSTSNLTAIDTDDVSEGSSNLYFTNARVDARLLGNTITSNFGIIADNDGNKVELTDNGSIEITRTAGSPFIDFKDSTSEDFDQRIQVVSGNFNFTASGLSISGSEFIDNSRNIDIGSSTISSGAITSTGEVEATALDINGNGDISGNLTLGGYIAGPATFTIDPAAVGDNTGTVVIAGNLQVDGTTTTINSTTMTVDDLNLTLASGAANAAAADGAGITVDGASATITYDGTNDRWDFNKDIKILGPANANGPRFYMMEDSTNGAFIKYDGSTNEGELGGLSSSGENTVMTWTRSASRVVFNENSRDMDFRVESNDNENMLFIDGGNNKVGIGTSSPSTTLHIEEAITGDASQLRISNGAGATLRMGITGSGGNEAAHIKTNSGENLEFHIGQAANATTPRVIFDSSGNVGIGNDNPSHKLHIDSDSNSNSVIRIDADDNRGANRYALDIVDDDTNSRGSVRISTTSGHPVLIQHSTDGKGIQIDHTTVGGYSDLIFTTKQNDGNQKVMHRLRSDMIDGTSGGEESEFSLYGMHESSEKLGLRIDRRTNTFINSFTTYGDYSTADTAGSNYHEIGTWTAGQSSRITIRINGAIGFSNNLDHAGETVIHGTISNAGDFEGFFYGVGSNSTASAVAVKANSSEHTIYIIPGQYGSFESHVTITKDSIWTPKTSSHSTGSSSLPSGAVALQSKFGVNISGSRKLLVNSSGNLELSNGLNSTAGTVQFSDGSSLFDSSDASGYPRFTHTNGSAQIGFARAGNNVGVGYIGADADNVFAIWDSSFTRKVVVKQTGEVGIGTTNPQDKLHIETGSSDEITTFRVSSAGQITLARNHSTSPSITSFMSSGIPRLDFSRNGVVETRVASNQDTWFNASTQGNVGIGTSSPDASIDVRRNTNTVNNIDSLGFDVVGNIGNAASNPGNHYTSGLRLYQGSGTVGSGLGVMYLGADNGNATPENDYSGQISAPDGMSGGLRLNTFHNDAKIRFFTRHSSTTALRMDIDAEGVDIQGVELYSSTSASLSTTATDFYVNSTGAIGSGTYLLKIVLQGGGWYSEVHTGIMRWYSGTTNNPTGDTIYLTGMGHANTVGVLNARVLRKYSNTNAHSLQLWLTSGSSSNHTITIQAAKLQD